MTVPLVVAASLVVLAGVTGFWMRRDPMPARLYLQFTAAYAMYAGIEVAGRAMAHLFLRLYFPAPAAFILSLMVTLVAIVFVVGAAVGCNALGGLHRDHNGQALVSGGAWVDRAPLSRVWARPLLLSFACGIAMAVFVTWWQPAFRGLPMIAIGGPAGLAILFAIAAGRTLQLASIVKERECGKDLRLMVPRLYPPRR